MRAPLAGTRLIKKSWRQLKQARNMHSPRSRKPIAADPLGPCRTWCVAVLGIGIVIGLLGGWARSASAQIDDAAVVQPAILPVAQIEEARPVFLAADDAMPDWSAPPPDLLAEPDQVLRSGYYTSYDGGFVIRPYDPETSPFSLKINNQNTFRYTAFSRGATSWVDSSGDVEPIVNSNDFMIPRGRLILSGNTLLPELNYLLNIDYNTVTNNPIGFRAFALTYRYSRALEVSVGQNKVPGTREWILSSWVAQEGPDRSMATTFFRPSLSQGVWFRGEPLDRFYYYAMVSNGFNTLNQTPSQVSNRLCLSDSVWWEPLGEFGPGYADIENHDELAVRLGSCYTFAFGPGSQVDENSVENSPLRLSDGTPIGQMGAFAPGVTLQRYNVALVALDFAAKYRGFSLSTEMYLQDLSALQGNGPLPIHATRAYGGFLQGGFFVVPQQWEIYSRASFVTGDYGSGTEIAGGFNWFPIAGKTSLRFTFDVADLDSSPADQNRTGFSAGQTGVLFRTQINSSF